MDGFVVDYLARLPGSGACLNKMKATTRIKNDKRVTTRKVRKVRNIIRVISAIIC